MVEESRVDQHPFLNRLEEAWHPHARVVGPVVVAVSGGGDSVGLLRGLFELMRSRDETPARRLVVAHARHDLRDGLAEDPAGLDAEFVQKLAEDLQLRCIVKRLAVRQAVTAGEGIEAAARRLRYAFLTAAAEECGARVVATAHTADDQVETILHRLLRGTGLAGLSGIPSVRELVEGIVVVRPMLEIPGSIVRGYLRDIGQGWREDSSNSDTRHTRNLLRHEILPRLEAGPYPAAREAILRLSAQASAASAGTAEVIEALLNDVVDDAGGGRVRVRATSLAGHSRDLLASLVVGLWKRQGWPRRDMTAGHYEAVADLLATGARSSAGDVLELPGGLRATIEAAGVLCIARINVGRLGSA
jgi:tRNA(Ile)-lysidine synthase